MDETRQDPLVLVLTTEANLIKAEELATQLLETSLVACVSLMPTVSHYRWQGCKTRSEEVQLILKTHPTCVEALYEAVMALHSYDTPEWITLAAQTRGSYSQWCADQLVGMDVNSDDGPPARSRSQGDGGQAG